MKTDESAAAYGNSRGSSRHHVMVASAVIILIVAHRTEYCQLVADRCQPRHVLREEHSGDFRLDRLEFAANLGRRVGLGIERLDVAGATVEPDQDAARFCSCRIAGGCARANYID